jgi:hypothetical protein
MRDLNPMYNTKEGYFNRNYLNQVLEDFRLTFFDHKFLYTLVNKLVEFDY